MNQIFSIKPAIQMYESAEEFCKDYTLGEGDLFLISESLYQKYFKGKTGAATVVNYRNYGSGEPTDEMVEGIYRDIQGSEFRRVIAAGGGTILDVAKLFALKTVSPVTDLYENKAELIKEKELILIPTTCGTGSEVTNISILELISRKTKLGLASDELYADKAVLLPELLSGLPFRFFATSSIDALIHSVESFTSPKANAFTELYSRQAMEMILKSYQKIVREGEDARTGVLKDMLTASTFAGIAFGNAGCGAVHAMSYPLGAACHVPHGEANYALFTGVYQTYQELQPNGRIQSLNEHLAKILQCDSESVYQKLDDLLGHILSKKRLREYGVSMEDLKSFTDTVMTKQGRLMANSYVPLDWDAVEGIYRKLW